MIIGKDGLRGSHSLKSESLREGSDLWGGIPLADVSGVKSQDIWAAESQWILWCNNTFLLFTCKISIRLRYSPDYKQERLFQVYYICRELMLYGIKTLGKTIFSSW